MEVRRKRIPTVVITGIASRLGRMLARAIHDRCHIIGIDHRPVRHMPKDITVHTLDLRRRRAEDIFRRNRVDAVLHLVPAVDVGVPGRERRARVVLGTHKVLEYCDHWEVPKVVVLSSAAVYGPNPDNSQFLREEAPLLAGPRFATIREIVEVDMYTQSYFWQHPEIDVVLLRPAHIVGRLENPASRYLGLTPTPTLLGYDPMVQVMAPEDVCSAIELAMKPGIRGIYNVAGPPASPLSEVIRRIGHRALPVPEGLVRLTIGALSGVGIGRVPAEEVDYLKYVCMVDDIRARSVLRYAPSRTLDQTLSALRR
jgi:UDP-glucose 4-epimerase